MAPLTVGQRLYLIRLACGDGVRRPEPAEAFGRRVAAKTGRKYEQATISRLETGGRNWLLEDIDAFAAVDPLQRGRAWLAGYDTEALAPEGPQDLPLGTVPAPHPDLGPAKARKGPPIVLEKEATSRGAKPPRRRRQA